MQELVPDLPYDIIFWLLALSNNLVRNTYSFSNLILIYSHFMGLIWQVHLQAKV